MKSSKPKTTRKPISKTSTKTLHKTVRKTTSKKRSQAKIAKQKSKLFVRLAMAAVAVVAISAYWWLPLLNGNANAATLSLCGNTTSSAPKIQHVVVVMMENRSYKQVVGNSSAPYQTSLTKTCGVGTSAFGATHTSASNYLSVSAGEYPASSPAGCGSVKACADSSDNVYHQLDQAGLNWRSYEETMPTACSPTTKDEYKIGHNPALFYTDISKAECQANDLPVSSLTAQSGAFWDDLQNQTLPALSWVTPSEDNDGEAEAGGITALKQADTWLQNFLGTMQQSNSYQSGNTAVIITYDEGSGGDAKQNENCANQSLDLPVTGTGDNLTSAHQDSCHVPFFVVYPYTQAGTRDSTFFDHYSITKTIEDLFGLSYIAHAADAGTNSLIGHFGLSLGSSTPPQKCPDGQTGTPPNCMPIVLPPPPPAACTAPPSGMVELSGNTSLEANQTGWTGVYNSTSSVIRTQPYGGSFDGSWALQVAPSSGKSGTAGVNNAAPIWETSTKAGSAYTGSALVKASTPGEKVSMIVRETTAGGTGVSYSTTTITLNDTNWHPISSTYKAQSSGNVIRYSLYATNFASSSQYFQADCLSLQAPVGS